MQRIAMASDIDGTLAFRTSEGLGSVIKKKITYFKKEDLEAIADWQTQGHLFGLCSGRPLVGVFDSLPDGIEPDFYIACSGAAVFDRDWNMIYESEIKKDDIRELFEKYKDLSLFEAFHTDSRDTLYRTVESGRDDVKEVVVTSLDDIEDRKIYSISIIFADDKEAEAFCADINGNYPMLTAFQNKNSADIVHKGCSKGDGILRIKEHLQVDVMAGIGDSFNDLPMLLAAWPSFTFHGSPESIQKQVTYVVDSVAEALSILGG